MGVGTAVGIFGRDVMLPLCGSRDCPGRMRCLLIGIVDVISSVLSAGADVEDDSWPTKSSVVFKLDEGVAACSEAFGVETASAVEIFELSSTVSAQGSSSFRPASALFDAEISPVGSTVTWVSGAGVIAVSAVSAGAFGVVGFPGASGASSVVLRWVTVPASLEAKGKLSP